MFFRNVFMKIKNLTNKLMHNSKRNRYITKLERQIMNDPGFGAKAFKTCKQYIYPRQQVVAFIQEKKQANRIVLIGCLCLIFIALGLSLPKLISRDSEPGEISKLRQMIHRLNFPGCRLKRKSLNSSQNR